MTKIAPFDARGEQPAIRSNSAGEVGFGAYRNFPNFILTSIYCCRANVAAMSSLENVNIGLIVHFILVTIAFLLILATIMPVREAIADIVPLM
jgi:hypothetical protein